MNNLILARALLHIFTSRGSISAQGSDNFVFLQSKLLNNIMKYNFFSRNAAIGFLLLLLCPLFIGNGFAQRDPNLISSRHYVGLEAGANYTWLPGSTNYFFTFDWTYLDNPSNPQTVAFTLSNPGSGIGFQFGGTLDLAISDFLGIYSKLQYRQHSTSSTETSTFNTTNPDGTNPGTADIQTTFRTRLGFLGVDAGLRFQFVKESFYGLLGLGFSDLLSDAVAIHQKIVATTNNSEFLFLPSRAQTGFSEFDIPFGSTNNYFKSSQLAVKLGIGTFIPLGGNTWVLTPELNLGIPLSQLVSAPTEAVYTANNAVPPKMWYATLSVALKFPFGATSRADMISTSSPTDDKATQGYTNLKGKVTDAKSGKPVQANVTVTDLNSNETVTTTKTDDDGEYNVRVKAPGRYSVTADADGYLFGSALYEVDDEGRILRGNHDIKLDQASGRTRLLIFFDFDKSELQRSSYPELERIVHLMKANPSMEVEIAGYTDAKGTDAYNHDLSHRRAESVKDYLLAHGISASRITTKGYGKDNPIATNDTEDGRAENRRVEFVVLKK